MNKVEGTQYRFLRSSVISYEQLQMEKNINKIYQPTLEFLLCGEYEHCAHDKYIEITREWGTQCHLNAICEQFHIIKGFRWNYTMVISRY